MTSRVGHRVLLGPDALLVRRVRLHRVRAARRHVKLVEVCALGGSAHGEERVERPVDERGHAETREERHLVDARRSEGHGATGGACEADNIDEDAGHVGGVRATGELEAALVAWRRGPGRSATDRKLMPYVYQYQPSLLVRYRSFTL